MLQVIKDNRWKMAAIELQVEISLGIVHEIKEKLEKVLFLYIVEIIVGVQIKIKVNIVLLANNFGDIQSEAGYNWLYCRIVEP